MKVSDILGKFFENNNLKSSDYEYVFSTCDNVKLKHKKTNKVIDVRY